MPLRWLKNSIPARWRERIRMYLRRRQSAARHFAANQRVLGSAAATWLWLSDLLPTKVTTLNLAGYRHPFYFRPRTSDVAVIQQVFVQREYEAVAGLTDIHLIIDCGANIGCTTFFLLNAYPGARAIVVERDNGNMDMCRRNLAPFAERVTFVQAGVWSESVPLKVVRGQFRDGQAWSFQVVPCSNNDLPDFDGVTLTELLHQSGAENIDLLKIDIEAGEKHLFSSDDTSWLDRTNNLAIELHDEDCRRAFEAAFRLFSCERSVCGELTICRDIRPLLQSSAT